MNLEQIKPLLQRYYDGETSVEEERMLSEFFSQTLDTAEYKLERIQFQFYKKAHTESTVKDYSLAGNSQKKQAKLIYFSPLVKTVSGIAAAILISFSAYNYMGNTESNNNQLEEDQSRIAYLKTKNALLLISTKLNKGTKELHQISKLNKAQNLIRTKNN